MNKIVASYLVKVHLHVDDEQATALKEGDLTNEQVKQAVMNGIVDNLGYDVSVSLIERTDD